MMLLLLLPLRERALRERHVEFPRGWRANVWSTIHTDSPVTPRKRRILQILGTLRDLVETWDS